MDIESLMSMAEPFLENINPRMVKAFGDIISKFGADMEASGDKLSIANIKALKHTSEVKSLLKMMDEDDTDFEKVGDTVLPPISVVLKVTEKELKDEATRKFRASPSRFSTETMSIEKKRKLFKLKLNKDQLLYTIESMEHGRVFVKLDVVEEDFYHKQMSSLKE